MIDHSPSHESIDRRQFLAVGAVSALTLVLPGTWREHAPSSQHPVLAAPELLEMLGAPERVRVLGRRYRSAVPEEDSREALVTILRSNLGSGPPSVLRSRLNEQVREDFAAGRTVTLDGWVLAVTEARQCALYSLS